MLLNWVGWQVMSSLFQREAPVRFEILKSFIRVLKIGCERVLNVSLQAVTDDQKAGCSCPSDDQDQQDQQ